MQLRTTLTFLCLSLRLLAATGLMYDVVQPLLLPGNGCEKGCADWTRSSNETVRGWWSDPEAFARAATSCAQPSKAPGLTHPSPVLDPSGIGGQGAWCLCAAGSSKEWDYCVSAQNVPEQINLQLAGPSTLVASFVTFEADTPVDAPVAEMWPNDDVEKKQNVSGVTHMYVSPSGKRTYWMHFIKFFDLEPRKTYTYRVRSGRSDWSDVFTFRSPYAEGVTNVAIFGDMGVYTWNNMQNMLEDASAGSIDAVVHIGDHSYNMGGEDERRGDAYMQAYEKILGSTPWIPVVGNHEFYDGDELRRYLNQTEGTVVAATAGDGIPGWSTATSALGALLSTGNHHAAGLHGSSVPSGTSRYYSVDLGNIHFVALDLNMYNGVDTCGEPCRRSQLAWLEKDLAAADANRDAVPWIVAMSHFPLYCSNCPAPGVEPGVWWNTEYCEYVGHSEACVVPSEFAEPAHNLTGAGNDDMVPDFEPLFMKYGVDVYASGHIHDYEWTYPIYNNTAVQRNFVNPKAPVHLVTGNGGPPSASSFGTISDWSYTHSSEDIGVYPNGLGSYTRMTAFNASTMRWTQIANNDSRVLDELYITRTPDSPHGPFPLP